MADKPFDRVMINLRERPLSSDINQAQSQLDRSLRTFLEETFGGADGFIKGGFKVVEQSPLAMGVNVSAGLGFQKDDADVPVAIDGLIGLDDRPAYKPLYLDALHSFTVPTAPGGGDSRIDIIEVKADRRTENSLSRDILNTGTGAFDNLSVKKTLAFSADGRTGTVTSPAASTAGLSYKTGVVGTPGVEPAVTVGYIKVAVINVAASVTTIANAVIDDARSLLGNGKERTLVIPAGLAQKDDPPSGGDMQFVLDVIAGSYWGSDTASAGALDVALPLEVGDRIKSIELWFDEPNTSSERPSVEIYEQNPVAQTRTAIAALKRPGFTGGSGSVVFNISDADFPLTILADRLYVMVLLFPLTTTLNETKYFGAKVVYDRPA